jgi:hypothetical protein
VNGCYEAQVVAALGAVGVRPPDAYVWFGRRFAAEPGAPLADAIARRLLADFLAPGAPRPARPDPVGPAAEAASFHRALSQANCGRGSWQPGWRVAAVEEEAIAVVRPDGLVLRAPAEDCRVEGGVAEVRMPKDLAGIAPGVLRVLGDSPPSPDDAARVRLSWNVEAPGAVTLAARLTYALNRADVPFTLELLTDPARYGRRPGADLLLARADFAAAFALLRPLLRALDPHMADGVPALSRPLARGLGLAEEPTGGGESFGEHRCRLLAEALVAHGPGTDDERLDAVREHFAAAGIGLDAPYLQPGSTDAYDGS